MIVEGRLDDLISELLIDCSTAALDVIAPELQKKMESAYEMTEYVSSMMKDYFT